MEPTDMLSSLFSDPQKLQSAISMASSLLGGGVPAAESPAPPDVPESGAEPTPRTTFETQQPSSPINFAPPRTTGFDPSAELMSRAMPVISAIARSGQTAVSHEKANLLNSIKPFVSAGVGGHLDHAMRLVSVARMARSAMNQISGATHVPKNSDGTQEL